MTHDGYRELIQRELDGDLSSEEVVLLEGHVATCADCLREREQFSRMASVFGKIGNVKPERSFVPQMVPELPQYVQKKHRRMMPQVWRGLSVAAVVVLAIGYSTNWQYGIGGQLAPHGQQIASVQEQETATQPEQLKEVPEGQVMQAQSNGNTISAASSQPTLIAQETVKKTPQVKAVAAASADVQKVESQTGVKVEGGNTVSQGTATTSLQNQMVVAAVDATATDVKVDGNNVTVTLVPIEKKPSGSEVLVFGIAAASSGSQTVTFTDPDGNVISTAQVDLPPSDEVIGKRPRMSHVLDEITQEQVKNGNKEMEWATDSYQVVTRYLTDMGFAANAQVSQTNEAGMVHVVQGGMHYTVGLEQPFVKGAKGIWRPVSISRMINSDQPQAFEQPIVAYFDGLRAAGTITAFENLYVTDPLNGGTVTVNATVTKQNGAVDQVYQFTLKQGPDGSWTLNGQPTAR